MKACLIFVFCLITISCYDILKQGPSLNMKPIIGIYTQPSQTPEYPPDKWAYISASYIKYVEMAGGQVVPIDYNGTQQYLDTMFNSINGIIFPGGDVLFQRGTPFTDNAYYLFTKALMANKDGIHFPIWGTCLGFQLLNYLVSDFHYDILSDIQNEYNVTHELKVLSTGRLLNSMPAYLFKASTVQPIFYYHHNQCVLPSTYQKYPSLKQFFNILATAKSIDQVEYITLIEAFEYPFYGSQFHAEKNSFEWKVGANHDLTAIMVSQYFADYFVEQARKNNHSFPDQQTENAALIYNWKTVQIADSSFQEIYFFDNLHEQQQSSELVNMIE